MKIRAYLFLCFFLILPLFSFTAAQNTLLPDAKILKMIDQISIDSLTENVNQLVSFHTRHTFSGSTGDSAGIEAALQWAKETFNRYGSLNGNRLNADFHTYTINPYGDKIPETVIMNNVIAELPGTDLNDNRIILISAHIDSRAGKLWDNSSFAPGANDDASGVALVLEIARILSAYEFPCTIRFALFTGEEQGLYGSAAYAEKLKNEGSNLIALFNNDMVGNSTSSGTGINDNTRVRIFSEGVPLYETEEMEKQRSYAGTENDGKSRQLARYIKSIGETYVKTIEPVLIFRRDRFLRSGDHIPFNRRGFTAIRITEMNENYRHQHQDIRTENGIEYGDLPDFLDYLYMKKITALNLSAAASLASAPPGPQEVFMDVRTLGNSTKLMWKKPQTGTTKGYYVLIRETYKPFWEDAYYTEETEIEIPFSKDNYFFAVQSVDDKGHCSLPVMPLPLR